MATRERDASTTSRTARSSSRPKRSATRCAPPTCTPGMADVAALTDDAAMLAASDAIWRNVVGQKLYITGGIGATGRGEAFGGAVRAAEHDRVQRDLRRDRQRLLEPPPVPAPRRREVHRRDGAHALQRPDLRRVARRQVVLLSQSARVGGPACAAAVVRRRLLSRATSRGFSPRCPATSTRSRAMRSTSTSLPRVAPTSSSTGRQGDAGAGDAISVGRRGSRHGDARRRRRRSR